MSNGSFSELATLNDVVAALERLPDEGQRRRVLRTAATFLGLDSADVAPTSGEATIATARESEPKGAFSEDRTISPKEFLVRKQPKTDVERVACLGYYLTHYRDTPQFKTLDISKLNTEAAQPKFSNAAVAVNNATLLGYLVQATRGNKQLSAQGELFVQALPDREAAKVAMASLKPRRRRRKSTSEIEEIRNNEQ